ncbi:MAG: MFS transporter [Rickettsiaceae bacterium]|nr:MFS transporter [Rickettsiaceae bacterium]
MINKRDVAILLGNVIDHFDRSLYIFLAPIIAPLFFPNSDEVVSLILAYLVLSGDLVAKPLGKYIFAIIADNHGPGIALSYSLIGIGIFTGLISILPTYTIVGVGSSILLVILRLIGGVFAAGEILVANLYILEGRVGAGAIRRSYLYQSSTIVGIIAASLAATIVFHLSYSEAWRIPFGLGAVAAFIGYFFRIYFFHTELVKVHLKKSVSYNLKKNIKTLNSYKLLLFKIILTQNISQITYVLPFVVMNHFVPLITGISTKMMMLANNFMLVFDLIMLFVIGEISTKFTPEILLKYSSGVLTVTIIPLWFFIENSSLLYVSFIRFWIVTWGIIFLCPLSVWCRDQVSDAQARYLIIGMGNSISSIFAGKITPVLCLWFYYITGSYMVLSLYFFIIFAACWLMLVRNPNIN